MVEANQTRELVELRLVDPHTGETVTEAQLGTRLQIVMELTPQEGLAAKSISAFGCTSEDMNGTQRVELTDFDGCQASHSPVSALKGDDGLKLESAIFPIFTFPQSSDVTFQCGFEFCFEEDSNMCKNRCDYKGKSSPKAGKRRYRRSLGGELKTLQTTLHILPGGLVTDTEKAVWEKEEKAEGLYLTSVVLAITAAICCLAVLVVAIAMRRGRSPSSHPSTPPPQAV